MKARNSCPCSPASSKVTTATEEKAESRGYLKKCELQNFGQAVEVRADSFGVIVV